MKTKLILSGFFIINLSQILKAQDTIKITSSRSPIVAETLIGNNRLYYQMLMKRKFTTSSKAGFLSISSFAANHNNDIAGNEFMANMIIYHDISRRLAINTGAMFSSIEGLKPNIGFQYSYANKRLFFLCVPNYSYLHDHKLSSLAIIEYNLRLNGQWSVYSRLQGYYAYNTEKGSHYRSFAYGRVGLTHSVYTLGLGGNADWYGPRKLFKDNIGVFVRLSI